RADEVGEDDGDDLPGLAAVNGSCRCFAAARDRLGARGQCGAAAVAEPRTGRVVCRAARAAGRERDAAGVAEACRLGIRVTACSADHAAAMRTTAHSSDQFAPWAGWPNPRRG